MKRSILFALFAAMLCILPSCAAQDTPETLPSLFATKRRRRCSPWE